MTDSREEVASFDDLDAAGKASVRITADNVGGSGTVIGFNQGKSYALILTNKHVVPKSTENLWVNFPGKARKFRGLLLEADPKSDLSLLAVFKEPWMEAVSVADSPPAKSDSVTQIGYPKRQGPVRRDGQWLGDNPSIKHQMYGGLFTSSEISCPTEMGESGSGVFSGNSLVGVVWGGPKYDPGPSACVSVDRVHLFLRGRCAAWLGRKSPPPVVVVSPPDKADNPYYPPKNPPPPQVDLGPLTKAVQDLAVSQAKFQAQVQQQIADLKNLSGKSGRDGKDGSPGKDGAPGKNGKDGSPGKDGAQGAAGKQGPPGPAGSPADSARIAALEAALQNVQSQLQAISGQIKITVTNPPSK